MPEREGGRRGGRQLEQIICDLLFVCANVSFIISTDSRLSRPRRRQIIEDDNDNNNNSVLSLPAFSPSLRLPSSPHAYLFSQPVPVDSL